MDFGSLSPALILVTVVSLALAPFVAVMVTSFTKLVVVLSLLRMRSDFSRCRTTS